MRELLAIIGLMILLQSTVARAGDPVSHSHAGRSHIHPLPVTGVSHRHGNGAPGVLAGSSSGITGAYTPGGSPDRSTGTITGHYSPPVENQATVSSIRTANPPQTTAGQAVRGKADCRRTDPDCNVCALNVRQQFNRAAAGQIDWQSRSWRFNWGKNYPPQKLRPLDLFKGDEEHLLGVPDKHVQGFVRTNSGRFPFAGSHSHKQRGGIFLLAKNRKNLAVLMQTGSKHPSGVQAFGRYLVYGENGRVYLKDLDRPAHKDHSLQLPGPKANFGGGVGLVKLHNDDYLLISTGPGGQDERLRYNRFYRVTGEGGQLQNVRYINQAVQESPPQWPAEFRFAENLSLITECGSGDIYVIHATGDQHPLGMVSGKGYWRLSQLQGQGQQLRLQPVNAFVNEQSIARCSMRAAASVHITPAKRLEFYCHGYAKNPEGSTFNILGKSRNKFRYTVGIPQ